MVLQLRIERMKKGWNQAQLALRSGISQWKISFLERGLSPKPEEAAILSIIFERPPEELFAELQD